MKKLGTLLFFFLISIFYISNIYAQVEMIGDTIQLQVNGYKGGNIQWQFSKDKNIWRNIDGAENSLLSHKVLESGFFRAKITVGSCSFFSDTTSIEAFNFNNKDENGLPILSKRSEYVILIPDIQGYTFIPAFNKYLEKIIDWIINFNATGFKIKAVLQVGDVTNNNTTKEWEFAQKIFSKLDNKIDYILAVGNHDYGMNGTTDSRETHFSEYFNYKNTSSFISSFEKDNFENAFFKIQIHNQSFQIFSLEFGPRDKILTWADNLAKTNSDALGIVMTHAYLYKDKERYDHSKLYANQNISPYNYAEKFPVFGKEKVNDGEEIWQKLINVNPNIKAVLCGHKTIPNYVGNLISANKSNHLVLQMLFDTQDFPNGGDGWIQILEFLEDKKTVNIKTYSTICNCWNKDQLQQYSFKYR